MGSDVQHKQESNGSLNKPDVDMNKDDREKQGPVEVSKGQRCNELAPFVHQKVCKVSSCFSNSAGLCWTF